MTTMVPHMMLALVLVCGASPARDSPVLPDPAIIQYLPLQDRCLFICNICFDTKIKLMGFCANDVCPEINNKFVYVNQWLSKTCQIYDTLQPTFFPQDNQVQL